MSDLLSRLSDNAREQAHEVEQPEWMDPMQAKLTHDHFSDDAWLYERKLDGERVIVYIESDGKVRLMSRNQECLNDSYPELERALKECHKAPCILDGEVVALNDDGVSEFQKLQARMKVSSRDEACQSDVKVHFYFFDCLYIDGYDVTDCPLTERKKVLKEALDWQDPLRFTEYRKGDGLEYYQEACDKGWEGLIAKDGEGTYVHSRSPKWLKFKCVMEQEFVIGGYTEPEGDRVGFGALLLGFYRDAKFVYAGQVGTGFDDDTLRELHDRLQKIERDTSPYDEGDPQTKDVHFVTPELVCEVGFTEWTKKDQLRHPRYKGLRRDKEPEDVHKEEESQAAEPEL
ncbi:hypothetical protein IDSA_06145 [Pseudidiomarina salinarum]|uniref:DNA ligase (ATP) n=1 Tax=Pseudidiomarina salinarum TaxID=435908 RepID=A0A094IYY8_9GAMM|nr:non-homologous end-joining DNA ligase [Pseudidiomarina salinarum]KFZ31059.1 hypothetical protein IDSA_06145 [Pseudidiomarina salinarum]RUO71140.1 ATP-dependent DNA ligase [Pseudidiomarina salinarum]